jgi:AP endonuclease-1
LADEVRDQYLSLAKEHCYDSKQHVLPHGSYLVNLAQPEQERADQAFAAFVDDLKRCEALGIKLYNFHPGNSGGDSKDAACRRIAQQLNRAHKATKSVVTVLENMAGTGNVIGSRFEELRDIIANVDDKNRVAVCLDTCHTFAAGYDLRTPETVGMKYLKAFHRKFTESQHL